MNNNIRWFIFISVATLILALGCYFVVNRTIARTDFGRNHSTWLWSLAGVFLLLQISGPLLYRTHGWAALQWITYITMGFFAVLFFSILIAETLSVIATWTGPMSSAEKIGQMQHWFYVGAILFSVLALVIGSVQALMGPGVENMKVKITSLPPELEGLKIAQISDLHVGPTIRKSYVQKIVQMTNELAPDFIVITGDLYDGLPETLLPDLAPLKELKARHPVLFCTGNHEYYWDFEAWQPALQSLGFEILLNEHLAFYNESLVIAGVSDLSAGSILPAHKSDAQKALLLRRNLRDTPGSGQQISDDLKNKIRLKIALAHQPGSFRDIQKMGFDLQLSGHTHGGQFVPWNFIVKFVQPFYRGLGQHESLQIYTNRGTGYWGPPNRFLVPGEITLLTLSGHD